MISTNTSMTANKLILQFILENIDYSKRCLYLQEIISLGKMDEVWRKALLAFLDTPLNITPLKAFSKN